MYTKVKIKGNLAIKKLRGDNHLFQISCMLKRIVGYLAQGSRQRQVPEIGILGKRVLRQKQTSHLDNTILYLFKLYLIDQSYTSWNDDTFQIAGSESILTNTHHRSGDENFY